MQAGFELRQADPDSEGEMEDIGEVGSIKDRTPRSREEKGLSNRTFWNDGTVQYSSHMWLLGT